MVPGAAPVGVRFRLSCREGRSVVSQLSQEQAVESVFPRLEPLLMSVSKPVQYVGGELNSLVKDWSSCDVRWCLMYPDAYEVGLPNQGVQILYEVLGERVLALVDDLVEDLHALVRQPDLVGIGVHQRPVDLDGVPLLRPCVELTADVLDRLADAREQGLERGEQAARCHFSLRKRRSEGTSHKSTFRYV